MPDCKPLVLVVGLAACADDISPEGAPADTADAAPGAADAAPRFAHVTHVDEGDGVTLTGIDATSETAWIYLDLERRAEVDAASTAWDLGFQRFKLELNGGTSGDGLGALVALPGQAFDAVTSAPEAGWVEDGEAGFAVDADGQGWYAYDPSTHRLSPRDVTYVIRTAEGGHVKLRFVDYYDAAGGSGHPSFRWKVLP
jgi:hypothetical protein